MQAVVNALTSGSIYLLFALGMSVAWGTIGVLNFAHGAIFMFTAFLLHTVASGAGLSLPVLLVTGAVVGAAISALTQLLVFEPIQRRSPDAHRAELQILVGGIGVASILLAISQRVTQSVPFGFPPGTITVTSYDILGARVTNIHLIVVGFALVLSAAVGWWLSSSRVGLGLRSIGVDPEVATMMGINRRRLARGTMALAGGLSGVAGVLLTLNLGSIVPETGDAYLLKGFAAIILGGVGTVRGTVLGAFLLAAAETVLITTTSGQWVDAIAFALIFAMLLLRPNGILGHKEVRRT